MLFEYHSDPDIRISTKSGNVIVGTVAPNSSATVSPTATTTHTVTASGPGGTATASVTVTVGTPAPTVTFTADPATIPPGGSSTLTWSSANADSRVIQPGDNAVPTNGFATVSPAVTTTFTITATGPGGSVSAEVTVTVSEDILPPAVSFSASATATVMVSDPVPTADIDVSSYAVVSGGCKSRLLQSGFRSVITVDRRNMAAKNKRRGAKDAETRREKQVRLIICL